MINQEDKDQVEKTAAEDVFVDPEPKRENTDPTIKLTADSKIEDHTSVPTSFDMSKIASGLTASSALDMSKLSALGSTSFDMSKIASGLTASSALDMSKLSVLGSTSFDMSKITSGLTASSALDMSKLSVLGSTSFDMSKIASGLTASSALDMSKLSVLGSTSLDMSKIASGLTASSALDMSKLSALGSTSFDMSKIASGLTASSALDMSKLSVLASGSFGTSAVLSSDLLLTKTIRAFSEISSDPIKLRDLSILGPDRFAVITTNLLDAGTALTSSVDQFGVASILLRTNANNLVRGVITNLLEKTADNYEAAFNFERNVRPPAFVAAEEYEKSETQLDRNKRAYASLLAFEIKMRKFIGEKMEAKFGRKWIKQRVPNEIREQWETKKSNATSKGRKEEPLISYADFTDYVRIIERKDNWSDVFEPIFGRRESIAESLLRLYPIRLSTMHARILTEDDELWLEAEVRRVFRWIGD